MSYLSLRIAFMLFFAPILLCAQISFKSKSYQAAKETALANDKAFFAYFSGTWCASCQIMEETTFQSQAVAMAVNDKYETYKVDFDNPNSADWKDEFEICCLPSVLIFDENAQLLTKIEQPLTSTRLVELLNDPLHFDPELDRNQNLEEPTQPVAVFTSGIETKALNENTFKNQEKTIAKADNEGFRIIIRKSGTLLKDVLEDKKEPVEVRGNAILIKNENTSPVFAKAKRPKKHQTSFVNSNGTNFQVQVGYFSNLENAMKMSQKFKSKYIEETVIEEDFKENKVFYRVLMGNYNQIDGANKLYKELKKSGQRASIWKK